MQRRFMIAALLALVVACGGSNTAPTRTPAPAPIPPAQIVSGGGGSFINCLLTIDVCDFQGELRNSGAGCANDVRGIVRFFNASGQQLYTAFSWSLTATQVIRPNESFTFRARGVQPASGLQATATYRVEPSWTDVRC